jgi:hypothetical protein
MACDLTKGRRGPGIGPLWRLGPHLPVWLAALALAAGCGSGTPSATPATRAAAARAAAAKKAANPAEARLLTMVNAVPSHKPTTLPVQVKFDLRDRPQVAQPLDIEIVIVPLSAAVDSVSGAIEADEGLDLVDGASIPATDRPAEGVPIEHNLKVLPTRDGIFTFRVTLTVDSAGQTSSETFSMPVIAGAGMPAPPKPAAAPGGRPPATPPKTAALQ